MGCCFAKIGSAMMLTADSHSDLANSGCQCRKCCNPTAPVIQRHARLLKLDAFRGFHGAPCGTKCPFTDAIRAPPPRHQKAQAHWQGSPSAAIAVLHTFNYHLAHVTKCRTKTIRKLECNINGAGPVICPVSIADVSTFTTVEVLA